MILEIDAGNTFIKWRTLTEAAGTDRHGRFYTSCQNDVKWPEVLSAQSVDEIRVSSVAGATVNEQLRSQLSACFGISPRFALTRAKQAGVTNSYKDPARMGVDRWLVMLAAWNSNRSPCCIVDCGSAITVDYLSEEGVHQGGYIMPGLRLLKRSLLSSTAEVLVDQSLEGFNTAPGCHTSAAVEQGVNLMFKALQEKILCSLESGMQLYVTGGDGELFQRLCGEGEYRPELVMDGLAWAFSD